MGRKKPRIFDSMSKQEDSLDSFAHGQDDDLDEKSYLTGAGDVEDRFNVVYLSFILLGAATLLPYNAFLSAPTYFGEYYQFFWTTSGQVDPGALGYYQSMSNWFLVWYSATSILTTIILQFTVQYLPLGGRIVGSCICSILILIVPPVISYVRPAWAAIYGVYMLWIGSGLVGITCAVFQSAVYGLAALIGGDLPQATMTGIGVVGTFVSGLRLITIFALPDSLCNLEKGKEKCNAIKYCEWIAMDTKYTDQGGSCITIGEQALDRTRLSAAVYFWIGIGGLVFTLIVYFLLPHSKFYRQCMQKYDAAAKGGGKDKTFEDDSFGGEFGTTAAEGRSTPLHTLWKIKSKAYVIFFTFLVTLWIFPNLFIVTGLRRINDPPTTTPSPPNTPHGYTQTPQISDEVYIELLIVLFNVFDTVGRFLPKFKVFRLLGPKALPWVATARIIFLVVFSTTTGGFKFVNHGHPWLYSQWWAVGFVMLFAISNGYISTLGFMHAPSSKGLQQGELEVVGVIVALSLFVGVACGSALGIVWKGYVLYLPPPVTAKEYPPAVAMPAPPF